MKTFFAGGPADSKCAKMGLLHFIGPYLARIRMSVGA